MQLVAYGAQDAYLTGNPKVTFFQAVYKRHTNFAMENIEQVVNGSASDDGRLSVTIGRNGDLVSSMYLELDSHCIDVANVTTSAAAFDLNWVAERAIKDIELTIGGQRIDKHYQKWWRIYSELYLDDAKKIQYGKMTSTTSVNATASKNKVYLPLIFFFNRNPGMALPLIALQYHEVRLDFDLGSKYTDYFGSTAPKVWANYIYLDNEERKRFAQKEHEYLIEQIQHTGVDTVAAGSQQIRLSYNHPVKSLNWCYTKTASTDTDDSLWNFTAVGSNVILSCLPSNVSAYDGDSMVASVGGDMGCPMVCASSNAAADTTMCAWSEEGACSLSAAAIQVGPLSSFKVILNGQDRFKEQSGKYFNQVQPSQHYSGNPYPGIYSYSFALKPEDHQPTGTCNFSRIDNAQVSCTLKTNSTSIAQHMFAVNYNVLRVQSGMGGLAFSN